LQEELTEGPWSTHSEREAQVSRTVDRTTAAPRRRRWPVLAVLLTLIAGPTAGQQTKLATVRHELDWAVDDIVHVWTAPFRVHGRDLPPLLAVTAPGLLLGAFDRQLQQWMDSHQESWPVKLLGPVREHGVLDHVGRTYLLVPLSVGLFLTGAATDDADLRDAGLGCATANLATTLPRATGSRLIGRRRPLGDQGPYQFKPFTFDDWTYYSLPGGHAANIMACSSFWAHRLDLGAGEPLLYVFAVALGVGRTIDRAHWASDTWFGIALGWAVGRLIADRMSDRRAAAAADPAQQVRVPLFIGWRFAF
jgi:membrane-associated phospholipid phosphatase